MPQPTFLDFVSGNLVLRAPYNKTLVANLHQIDGAKWDSAAKAWIIPYSEANLVTCKQLCPVLEFGSALRDKAGDAARSEIANAEAQHLDSIQRTFGDGLHDIEFPFTTDPFAHQRISFSFAISQDAVALFLEQGLGKAKVTIDATTWRHRRGQVRRALVVCPPTVLGQWAVEIAKHGHPAFKRVLLLSGSSKNKIKQLEEEASLTDFILVNYEALLNLEEFLLKRQRSADPLFDMLAADESSAIKHAASKRSKVLARLGLTVKYRMILSGTPVTQSAEDLFSQFRFLKPSVFGPYATAFRSQYLVMGGFENRQVIGYRNVGELMRRVYSCAIRFTKDRCLDLPPKVYEKRVVKLDVEASKLYRDLERECVAELGNAVISAPHIMTRLMKAAQITGGFVYEAGPDGKRVATHDMESQPKLDALQELLEEVGTEGKAIVWGHFRREIELICGRLEKMGIGYVVIDGNVKDPADRAEAVRRFQEDSSIKVFVGQQMAASHGITLTAASLVVYYSNTFNLEYRLQSEDRAHRIGQKKSVTYVDLVAETADGKATVDQDYWDVLQDKGNFARLVSNDLMARMAARVGDSPDIVNNPRVLRVLEKVEKAVATTGEEF